MSGMPTRSDLIVQHLNKQVSKRPAMALKQDLSRGVPPKAKAGAIAVRGHVRRTPRGG